MKALHCSNDEITSLNGYTWNQEFIKLLSVRLFHQILYFKIWSKIKIYM